jgi:hypothetical protein
MNMKQLDDGWKGWLRDNIVRGCNPEELLDILLKNHFALDSIRHNMGEKFPANSSLLSAPAPSGIVYYR